VKTRSNPVYDHDILHKHYISQKLAEVGGVLLGPKARRLVQIQFELQQVKESKRSSSVTVSAYLFYSLHLVSGMAMDSTVVAAAYRVHTMLYP
jgi:hypothetical protein